MGANVSIDGAAGRVVPERNDIILRLTPPSLGLALLGVQWRKEPGTPCLQYSVAYAPSGNSSSKAVTYAAFT